MIIVLLLTLISVGLYIFAIFSFFSTWKRHRAVEKKYLIRAEKSELVHLVGLGKIGESDELFERVYKILDNFEEACDSLSYRHIIEFMMKLDKESLAGLDNTRFYHLVETASPDVKKTIKRSFETIGKIILSNSLTISFFFYLLRLTFVKIIFQKFPRFLLNGIKAIFRNRWDVVSKLIYFEDKLNLRFN